MNKRIIDDIFYLLDNWSNVELSFSIEHLTRDLDLDGFHNDLDYIFKYMLKNKIITRNEDVISSACSCRNYLANIRNIKCGEHYLLSNEFITNLITFFNMSRDYYYTGDISQYISKNKFFYFMKLFNKQ